MEIKAKVNASAFDVYSKRPRILKFVLKFFLSFLYSENRQYFIWNPVESHIVGDIHQLIEYHPSANILLACTPIGLFVRIRKLPSIKIAAYGTILYALCLIRTIKLTCEKTNTYGSKIDPMLFCFTFKNSSLITARFLKN